MNKIIYIGMDVHSSNFTLCSYEPGYGVVPDKIFGQVQFKENIFNNTFDKSLMVINFDVEPMRGSIPKIRHI